MDEVGAEPLVAELGLDNDMAGKVVESASQEAKKIAAEKKQAETIMETESPLKQETQQEQEDTQ